MNKNRIFILILIFWIIVVAGLIGFKQYTINTGTRITLKTLPVDPRDILRGDYITLRYDINNLNLNSFKTDIDLNNFFLQNGDRIYIKLKGTLDKDLEIFSPDKNVFWNKNVLWTPVEVTRKKPNIMRNSLITDLSIVIRGTVTNVDYQYKTIKVNYGIENYFVPEGSGTNIQNLSGKGLDVNVIIDRFGSAIVNKLYLNGEELKFRK
jgi:uncharacterized membrane-anchored protein